jgi:hypothetical protein
LPKFLRSLCHYFHEGSPFEQEVTQIQTENKQTKKKKPNKIQVGAWGWSWLSSIPTHLQFGFALLEA